MTTPNEPTTETAGRPQIDDVACPFCALVCDDVSLPSHNQTDDLACPRARDGFALALGNPAAKPALAGKPVDWETALAAARQHLGESRLPLFHGLLGDLADARAAWTMAGRFGGVVDHRDGDALTRGLAVYQDSGWITTSLAEARNRADVIVWVGEPTHQRLPRLAELVFDAKQRLHADGPPRIVELGAEPREQLDQARVLLGGRPLARPDPAAVALTETLRDADYAVFLIGELRGRFGEQALRAASELVRDINETRRAAMLLIGNGPGDVTAHLCGAWHTGFGIRTSLARGFPEQDLDGFAGQRLLDAGEADLLVWISSLDATPPPQTAQPQIVFGHPSMRFGDSPPAVFLPVAVPGIHRAGFLHRGDGLRLVPLRQLQSSELPATNDLCARLLADDDNNEGEAC